MIPLILKLNYFTGIIGLLVMAVIIYWYFNRKTDTYKFMQRMEKINYCIYHSTVDQINFDYIDDLFRDLYIYDPTLEDQERVKFLFDDFLKQFEKFNRYKVEDKT